MVIVQKKESSLIKLVMPNISTGATRYRLSIYSIVTEVPDGVLVYNTLTCGMVFLNKSEFEVITENSYLRENLYVVPAEFEEQKASVKLISLNSMVRKPKNGYTSYTILTTTDCNARCFYCYEMGRSRIPMTRTTAEKVAEYILDNWRRFAEDERPMIKISWFGGEPLFNAEVIDVICSRLREAGCDYRSSMVTNAYLFDADMIQRAKEWNLRRVQVTLDGTEDVYNRSKAFIYADGSAYEKVMQNIGYLLATDIRVTVRMNIDVHNADDLLLLANVLAERFKDYTNLRCYSHPLFEAEGPDSHLRTEERRIKVYEKQAELRNLLIELKLFRPKSLQTKMKFNRCMSDDDASVVIVPTGDIGKCEHYSDKGFFSHIDTPDKVDKEQLRKFAERSPDLPLCADCLLYPQCIRLKVCETGVLCFPELKTERINELKVSMLSHYEKWKSEKSVE